MTALFFCNSSDNPLGVNQYDLLLQEGTVTVELPTTLVSGNTAGIQATRSAGGPIIEWVSPPLAVSVTLSGSIVVGVSGRQTTNNSNSALMARFYHMAGDGTGITKIGADAISTEFTTANTVKTLSISPGGVLVNAGRRFLIRIYAKNAPSTNMGTGTTTFVFGPGAGGYVTPPETLTFSAEGGAPTVARRIMLIG